MFLDDRALALAALLPIVAVGGAEGTSRAARRHGFVYRMPRDPCGKCLTGGEEAVS